MSNVFMARPWMEELEEAASGAMEALPYGTLREKNYGNMPLIVKPEYSGDFLDKLRSPFQGKAIEAVSESLTDFSMPSEWLKHQEEPVPRIILDDFYEMTSPGEDAGAQTLHEYWDRGWGLNETPEVSEDLLDRDSLVTDDPTRLKTARVIEAFNKAQFPQGPSVHTVIASYMLEAMPVEISLYNRIRIAKLMQDIDKPRLTTKTKGVHPLDLRGVSVRLKQALPHLAKWIFVTGSGHGYYTTIFEFVPKGNITDVNKLDVRVSCSCPSWLYWGAQYNALIGGYIYGPVRIKGTPPGVRDPNGTFTICKHVLAAMEYVKKYSLYKKIAPGVKKKLTGPQEIRLEKPIPKEDIRIPMELQEYGRDVAIKKAVRDWDKMSDKEKDAFIMGLDRPGAVAYMAHRFPEDATVSAIKRLKEFVVSGKDQNERRFAKHQLDLMHIPVQLHEHSKQSDVTKAVSAWPKMTEEQRKERIMSLDSPGAVAFLAHRFPDTAMEPAIQKLTEMVQKSKSRSEKQWAEKLLRHWTAPGISDEDAGNSEGNP
jgi:hypothetical protein